MAETWTFAVMDARTPRPLYESFLDLVGRLMKENHPDDLRPRSAHESFVRSAVEGRTSSRFLVAYDAGKKARGMALYTACTGFGGDWVWLHEIYADPDSRGAGLGTALSAEVVRRCKEQGARCLIGATTPDNKVLLALADRFGMTRQDMIWLELHFSS